MQQQAQKLRNPVPVVGSDPPQNSATGQIEDTCAPARQEITTGLLPSKIRDQLLAPEFWQEGLSRYALATNLAVALVNAHGDLIGECLNPQPLWVLLRGQRTAGQCPFCISEPNPCTCIASAFKLRNPVVVKDRSGLVHFAVPLALGEDRLGAVIAGQVFDRYPETLALEQVARSLGLVPQKVWGLARLVTPISSTTLKGYADLLATLTHGLVHARHNSILEARRLADTQRAEQLSHTQQQWLESVLDLIPTPMLFLEPGTARVVFANRAANELVEGEYPRGKPGEEYKPSYFCTSAKGERIPNEQMPEVRVAKGERLRNFEMDCHLPSGQRSLIVSGDTLPAMYGNPATPVVTFHDLTPVKRVEQALQRAQKLECIGLLAGGVAHDFNNLLTGILGNASFVLDNLPPLSPDRQRVEEVMTASRRAADLTHQLLAYAGKGRFVIARCNLCDLVSEMMPLIQTSLPKKVKWRLNLAKDLPAIEADASQLQQIVMNLVINGAEAIGEDQLGTVVVTTGTEEIDDHYCRTRPPGQEVTPGTYAFLEVQDTGSGMDQETLAKIFDPFFTTKFTGRGLGLAAVSGIVRGHHGTIEVYSTPGHGSRFKVLFPAVQGKPEVRSDAPPREELQGTGLILVVEDEPVVRHFAKATLEKHGYEVLLAANGQEAIERLRSEPTQIALVLLDLTMPVMDGPETWRQIKGIQPEIPVVLSSGYDQAEATRRFTHEDLAGFLQKPYTAARLAEKIKMVLTERTTSLNARTANSHVHPKVGRVP